MLILVSGAGPTLRRIGKHPNLGYLVVPRMYLTEFTKSLPWAADNDCYSGFNECEYLEMLEIFRNTDPIFVSCPDVVADSKATRELFDVWEPIIRSYGLPVAYVLQDGQEETEIPWNKFEALFIGGTTEYKVGASVRSFIKQAKEKKKWVHMGRVNSLRRIEYARSLEVDSIDGSGFSRFSDRDLPPALHFPTQPILQKRLFPFN